MSTQELDKNGIEVIFSLHELKEPIGYIPYLDYNIVPPTTTEELLSEISVTIKKENIDFTDSGTDVNVISIEGNTDVSESFIDIIDSDTLSKLKHNSLLGYVSNRAMKDFYKVAQLNYEAVELEIGLTPPPPVCATKPTIETKKKRGFWRKLYSMITNLFGIKQKPHPQTLPSSTLKSRSELLEETIRQLFVYINKIRNYTSLRNRVGGGNALVCSAAFGAMLSDYPGFHFRKIGLVGDVSTDRPYHIGSIFNANIYVDPYLRFDDNIVTLFNDSHVELENKNGLHLLYYWENNNKLKFTIKQLGICKNVPVAIPTGIKITELI